MLQLALVDHYATDYSVKEAQLRLQQLSWQMRDSLDNAVRGAGADVVLLSELSAVRDAQTPAQARSVLESLQRTVPYYAWIGLAGMDGKVYASTSGLLENADVTARPWYRTGLRRSTASDFHSAALLGNLLPHQQEPWRFVDVAVPVFRTDGVQRGVLAVHMSWDWARREARNLLVPATKSYDAEIFVVRNDGMVILGPKEFEEKSISSTSLSQALRGETGSLEEVWPDGRRYLTGYAQTGQSNDPMSLHWAVLVRQPLAVAMAATQELKWRILVLSIVLGLALTFIAALLARYLTSPIYHLSKALERHAKQIAQHVEPEPIPEIDTFYEAQVLSRAMRAFIQSEDQYRTALESVNAQLESTVAERTVELRKLALSDSLTGLPNRRALMESLLDAVQRSARLCQPCAVLFMDLDGFKSVNDNYGHDEGDELLKQFAARIVESVRKTDTVARLAGDEFVVVLEMLTNANAAEATAHKILQHLSNPYTLQTVTLELSASIGVAIHHPQDAIDIDALLSQADVAMYSAKRFGKNQVVLASQSLNDNQRDF